MATSDYFLKINGIEGESTDSKHKAEIDVMSWSWGEAQSGAHAGGGGGGAGKVSMQDFHFTMGVCKASPKLMLSCASGQHIPDATLVCRKAGGKQEEYMTIKFSDLLISSFQTGGASGGDLVDQISFNFAKIEFDYKEQKADGTLGAPIKAGWDLKANKKA